jgi:class 3 adenylate cyclase
MPRRDDASSSSAADSPPFPSPVPSSPFPAGEGEPTPPPGPLPKTPNRLDVRRGTFLFCQLELGDPEPTEVRAIAEVFLEVVRHAMAAHHATLQTFEADLVVMSWNVYNKVLAHGAQASLCALWIQRAMQEQAAVESRSVVHTGEFHIGPLDTPGAQVMTMFSRDLRVAQRLLGLNGPHDASLQSILLTTKAGEDLTKVLGVAPLDRVKPEGSRQAIVVYGLIRPQPFSLADTSYQLYNVGFNCLLEGSFDDAEQYFAECMRHPQADPHIWIHAKRLYALAHQRRKDAPADFCRADGWDRDSMLSPHQWRYGSPHFQPTQDFKRTASQSPPSKKERIRDQLRTLSFRKPSTGSFFPHFSSESSEPLTSPTQPSGPYSADGLGERSPVASWRDVRPTVPTVTARRFSQDTASCVHFADNPPVPKGPERCYSNTSTLSFRQREITRDCEAPDFLTSAPPSARTSPSKSPDPGGGPDYRAQSTDPPPPTAAASSSKTPSGESATFEVMPSADTDQGTGTGESGPSTPQGSDRSGEGNEEDHRLGSTPWDAAARYAEVRAPSEVPVHHPRKMNRVVDILPDGPAAEGHGLLSPAAARGHLTSPTPVRPAKISPVKRRVVTDLGYDGYYQRNASPTGLVVPRPNQCMSPLEPTANAAALLRPPFPHPLHIPPQDPNRPQTPAEKRNSSLDTTTPRAPSVATTERATSFASVHRYVSAYREMTMLPDGRILSEDQWWANLSIRDPSLMCPTTMGNARVVVTGPPQAHQIWYCSTKILGSGGFGDVFLGMSDTGMLVAIKRMEVEQDKKPQLMTEIKLLSRFKHQNIIRYYGTGLLADYVMVVMEYACTTLSSILTCFGCLSTDTARGYTRDITVGLDYLHQQQVIHRDIKPENVLLNQEGVCKLADFGTAVHLSRSYQNSATITGTPHYMAPEMLRGLVGKEGDVWALGVTLWQMLLGRPVVEAATTNGLAILFKLGTMSEAPAIPDELPLDAKEFLGGSLTLDPNDRWTTSQLLKSDFLVPRPSSYPKQTPSSP